MSKQLLNMGLIPLDFHRLKHFYTSTTPLTTRNHSRFIITNSTIHNSTIRHSTIHHEPTTQPTNTMGGGNQNPKTSVTKIQLDKHISDGKDNLGEEKLDDVDEAWAMDNLYNEAKRMGDLTEPSAEVPPFEPEANKSSSEPKVPSSGNDSPAVSVQDTSAPSPTVPEASQPSSSSLNSGVQHAELVLQEGPSGPAPPVRVEASTGREAATESEFACRWLGCRAPHPPYEDGPETPFGPADNNAGSPFDGAGNSGSAPPPAANTTSSLFGGADNGSATTANTNSGSLLGTPIAAAAPTSAPNSTELFGTRPNNSASSTASPTPTSSEDSSDELFPVGVQSLFRFICGHGLFGGPSAPVTNPDAVRAFVDARFHGTPQFPINSHPHRQHLIGLLLEKLWQMPGGAEAIFSSHEAAPEAELEIERFVASGSLHNEPPVSFDNARHLVLLIVVLAFYAGRNRGQDLYRELLVELKMFK